MGLPLRVLAIFFGSSGLAHCKAGMKVVQYPLGTRFTVLTFDGTKHQDKLEAIVDGDYYATELDAGRSIPEKIVMLGSAAIISCFSRIHKVSAFSTNEAEFMRMKEIEKDGLFLRRQVHALMRPDMTPYRINIFEVNEEVLKMANNRMKSHRTKHIDDRHHFIRQQAQERTINIVHAGTENQHAEILTKALDSHKVYAPHQDIKKCLVRVHKINIDTHTIYA